MKFYWHFHFKCRLDNNLSKLLAGVRTDYAVVHLTEREWAEFMTTMEVSYSIELSKIDKRAT